MGGIKMKKIMSVLLALVMALSLFTAMGVVTLAEGEEYDAAAEGFSLTTADANGKKAARFKETLTEDEVYDLYQGNFNDDNTGWHNSEGTYEGDWSKCTYYIHDTSKLLTTGDDLVIGGYWCTAASSDLPMNALPIDFDIDLNGVKEISGVKIEATGNFGYVKAYEVYTFDGENWTLQKSGTGGQKLITASFGSNVATSKVRIRVTDTTRRTNGSASRFAADMPAYFGVSRLAVLKGASIETVAWETEPAVTEFYSSAGGSASGAPGNLFDGKIFDSGSVWAAGNYGSDGTNTESGANSAYFTVDLGKEYEFSAVRLYGRFGMWGQCMEKGNLYVSDNGTDWSAPIEHIDSLSASDTSLSDEGTPSPKYASSGDMYTDMHLTMSGNKYNVTARYIKVEVTKTPWPQWQSQELLLVAPSDALETKPASFFKKPDKSNGYKTDEIIDWETEPAVTEFSASNGAGLSLTNDKNLFDYDVRISGDVWGAPSFGSDGANLNGANSAYFTVDLGKEYEFSAVRLFGRFAMWGQAMEMGSLYISPDGKTWSKAFAHADTAGQSQKYTTADKSLFTVEYKSTGDIYTDMKANDKNLKARYIRVEATKTPWGQWHMQELMLVKPDESKDTLTAEEATAFYAEEAEKVIALIDAIGEVTAESGEKIRAARKAYDALEPYSKTLVNNYDTLTAAEAAYQEFQIGDINERIAALPDESGLSYDYAEEISSLKDTYDALSDENKAKITGADKLEKLAEAIKGFSFTLDLSSAAANYSGLMNARFTVPGDKTVTAVSYSGTDYTAQAGFVTSQTEGGKTVITLLGSYAWSNYGSWNENTVGGFLRDGKKVYARADIPDMGIKNGEEITVGTGKLTHTIAMDDPMGGDHVIKVRFDDGTETSVNLKTTGVNFRTLSTPGSTGKVDELTPTRDWRWASSDGSGEMERALNGKVASTGAWDTYWQTKYVAGTYELSGRGNEFNVIWFVPAPFTFYLDIGEGNEYNGVRFYPKTPYDGASNIKSVDIYGSDDYTGGWEKIGSYDLSGQDNSGALNLSFFEDAGCVSYRYLMFHVNELFGSSMMEIGNISLVRPYVTINGSDTVTADTDDEFVTDASFSFFMEDAESVVKVEKGGADIGKDNWTFENDTISLKADYVKTLPEGTTEIVVIFDNGNSVPVKITRVDFRTVTYCVIGDEAGNFGRGSGALVLNAVGGKKATKLTVNGKTVSFTQSGIEITVTRYNFRGADIWDNYKNDGYVTATAEFEGGLTADYKIILKGIAYKASSVTVSGYQSDEIEADDDWTVEVDSSQNADNIAGIFSNSGSINWHSGYTVEGSSVIEDSKLPHYVDFDLGETTEFSGIRYYRRTDGDNTAGMWTSVGIYGKENADDEWTLIKPMGNITYNDNETVADIKLDVTAKTRYVRLMVLGSGSHATAKWIRFLKATTPFKGAEMANTVVPMDYDLGENAVAKVTLNGAGRITSLTQSGAELPAEYVTLTDDTASISPYYFMDNGCESGDEVSLTLTFAFGPSVDFTVKVGEVDGYKIEFGAGENGTLKATAYNAELDREEDKASGKKVRNADSLTFTAIADEGFEVDSWTVRATKPVYGRLSDSVKENWSVTASSDSGNTAWMLINTSDDADNDYWHSGYTKGDDGTIIPDPNKPFILEFDFGGTVKTAGGFEFVPRNDPYGAVKDYDLYVTEEGKSDWTLVTSGTLPNNTAIKTIDFGRSYDITKLKLVIKTIHGYHVYISEVYLRTERVPSGTVVRRGTASEDFVIDDRFTDMAVSVTFKEKASGKVSVVTELKNAVSDAPGLIDKGRDATVSITPAKGYHAPDSVKVYKDKVLLKEGADYIFTKVSDDLSTVTIKNADGKTILIAAEGADWLNHKVRYTDSFGAAGTLPETAEVVEGEKFTAAKSTLKLVGYKFVGWSYNGVTYKAGDTLTMGDEDIVFSAVWEKDDSKKDESGKTDKPSGGGGGGSSKPSSGGGISGGSGGSSTYTVTVNGVTTKVMAGTVIAAPEAPAGYTFKGYYLDEALTVPYANDGVKANVTLYPAFEKNRARTDLTDIAGHWAEEYIASLYEKSIVSGSGDGKFNPDSNITRAEFIQILYNMSNMTSDGSQSFKDVKAGDWFSQAVAWAVNFGITSGTSEDTFSPYEKITREQMAAMIYRYATLMGADWQTSETGEFADEGEIAEYAKYQVRWAKGAGIISGRPDGSFGPKDNATRAESAAMLSRLVK